MNRVAIVVFLLLCSLAVFAQKTTKGAKPTTRKLLLPQAYFASTNFSGGVVKRDTLSKMLRKGIAVRDSAGNAYKVHGFEFGYAERGWFDDSAANPILTIDYLTEYCMGDTLSGGVKSSIYDRLKPGDTLFINRVSVYRRPTNTGNEATEDDVILSKGIKCVITK